MVQVSLPLTTYRVSAGKPNQRWGSPAALPMYANLHRVLIKVPIDKIPLDATIDSAILQNYADRAVASGLNVRIRGCAAAWTSSVTWNTQPAYNAVLDSQTTVATAAEQPLPGLNVTAWAAARFRNGLMLDTSSSTLWWVRGSSGADAQPVLVVNYHVKPDTPGELRPSGGSVSVPQPVLSYAGDADMTQQKIQYSPTGLATNITFDSGWLSATQGRFDPVGVVGVPMLSDGATGVYWRATTNGPDGESDPSDWAYYEYDSLPSVSIINPPALTDDGSPTLSWTVQAGRVQSAWKADLSTTGKTIDSHAWANETAVRDWTPDASVKVPGGSGRHTLYVRDNVIPRVAAEGAPTEVKIFRDFTTTVTGSGTAVNSLDLSFNDPVPTLTGTRALGTPDFVTLYRDGVRVPLWDADGNVYPNWAPAAAFFAGTTFAIPDYTARSRTTPTWTVRTKTGTTVSSAGPSLTRQIFTGSVWLVDPRTGDRVEVCSLPGDVGPVVEQDTAENSILHLPINGGLVVEPKRRRIVRSTRFGSIEGIILNDDEALLNKWVEADSSLKYRLIFGKINIPVIIGDVSQKDMFYADVCGPDRMVVTLNWWQRLSDV